MRLPRNDGIPLIDDCETDLASRIRNFMPLTVPFLLIALAISNRYRELRISFIIMDAGIKITSDLI